MRIDIKIFQDNNIYELAINEEFENSEPKNILGKAINKVFSFYQKGLNTKQGYIISSRIPIDIVVTYDETKLIDTRERTYDVFRDFFKVGKSSIIKRQFAKNLVYAYSKVTNSDEENDIKLNYSPSVYKEGHRSSVKTINYERNIQARKLCLNYWGYKCQVCGFDFYDTYGDLGLNYIQVHHKVPLSTIGKEYSIDPIKDLIPLCANCHAMIHRQKELCTIDELKTIIRNAQKKE